MKDLKKMFHETLDDDPKELIGGFLFIVFLFAFVAIAPALIADLF